MVRAGRVVEPPLPAAGDAAPCCPLCRRDGLRVPLVFHPQTAMWWHAEYGDRGRRCAVSCFVELPPQPEPGG